ncbi:MAG TPA: hypothetical protein VLG50_07470 [Candidatus Saccharimonadales bacterium]|nr:hypothetical protein [Candidatus Saccharimonadales bacterium]
MLNKVCISVTTYEMDDGNRGNPSVTHLFWGKDVKSAVSVAQSHLLTDLFFSESFVGEMPWKDFVLKMENELTIKDDKKHSNAEAEKIYKQINTRAHQIHKQKKHIGLIKLIHDLSNK